MVRRFGVPALAVGKAIYPGLDLSHIRLRL